MKFAISPIISLLCASNSDTRERGVFILVTLSKLGRILKFLTRMSLISVIHLPVGIFQEKSTQFAVLKIIALLGESNSDVRTAGADALWKLSQQGRIFQISDPGVVNVGVDIFRGPITSAIPQIISLHSHSDPGVREVTADMLLKLSAQGKISESLT